MRGGFSEGAGSVTMNRGGAIDLLILLRVVLGGRYGGLRECLDSSIQHLEDSTDSEEIHLYLQ